ncbi:hypothetical protein IHE56_00725 [Streptomyces sp. ID01-12c]|nr:hypothetical protein [Streptomyces caniscabiei]
MDYPNIVVTATTPNTNPSITITVSDGGEIDEAALAAHVRTFLAEIPGATNVQSRRSDITSTAI